MLHVSASVHHYIMEAQRRESKSVGKRHRQHILSYVDVDMFCINRCLIHGGKTDAKHAICTLLMSLVGTIFFP
jgi:hypothetical protein